MKNAIKEKNDKSVARDTVKSAMIILLVVVTAGAVCAGIAFARNGRIQIATSTENSQSAQAMKVAQATDVQTQDLVDNENMTVETDASGDKVPVPRDYVGSQATGENEINTGYVIYEGEEAVTDANVAEAQKTRNQYVWVPVPDVSKMYGTDANGKKWGKLYNFDADRTSPDTDPVTGAYPDNWTESNGVMTITSTTSDPSNREPDILNEITGYDDDRGLKKAKGILYEDYDYINLKPNTMHELLIALEQEFETQINSIIKYGGFYIGRYLTGDVRKAVPVIRKGNTDTIDNYYEAAPWYALYGNQKKLKGDNKNIETCMISGSAFDRTLMWLIESGNKTKEQVAKDASDWSRFDNSATGNEEQTKANNIYDLADGEQKTTEADSSYQRSQRGGFHYLNAPGEAPGNHSGYDNYNWGASRAVLYIK